MSANYYDLLKYAATGIASPSMTYYDRMRASTLMGGAVQTLTGIPPLSFKSNGKPLISWSMLGNGQQTGTPTPDNIIMPTFCGVRTGQLIPYPYYQSDGTVSGITWTTYSDGRVVGTGKTSAGTNFTMASDLALPNGTYTIAIYGAHSGMTLYLRDTTSSEFLVEISPSASDNSQTFTVTQPGVHRLYFNTGRVDRDIDIDCYVMLNLGSTALPYEPYGWAEKITCAGQTVPIYLGEVPTVRRIKKLVLTGDEANWVATEASPTGRRRFYLPLENALTSDTTTPRSFCSHLPLGATGATYITDNLYTIANNNFYIRLTADYNTLADLRSYLAQQYAAGTPVVVWYVLAEPETAIVNEPLAKIGDYADELHSEDAGVTIPTAKGQNTLTVETDLQPSEMTIKYRE